MARVEGRECALQLGQPVERHAGVVVVLEMVVRVEEREVPEPVAAHQRAPLRRIGGIDVVMLPEAIEREGDGEDEEDRDDVQLERDQPAADERDGEQHAELKRDRRQALARDAFAKLRFVR